MQKIIIYINIIKLEFYFLFLFIFFIIKRHILTLKNLDKKENERELLSKPQCHLRLLPTMEVFSTSLSTITHALEYIRVLCDPVQWPQTVFPSSFDITVGNPLWIGLLVSCWSYVVSWFVGSVRFLYPGSKWLWVCYLLWVLQHLLVQDNDRVR